MKWADRRRSARSTRSAPHRESFCPVALGLHTESTLQPFTRRPGSERCLGQGPPHGHDGLQSVRSAQCALCRPPQDAAGPTSPPSERGQASDLRQKEQAHSRRDRHTPVSGSNLPQVEPPSALSPRRVSIVSDREIGGEDSVRQECRSFSCFRLGDGRGWGSASAPSDDALVLADQMPPYQTCAEEGEQLYSSGTVPDMAVSDSLLLFLRHAVTWGTNRISGLDDYIARYIHRWRAPCACSEGWR
jgi:hypothetical protein